MGALVTINDLEALRGRSEDRVLAELLSESPPEIRSPTYADLLEAQGLPEEGDEAEWWPKQHDL